MKNAVIFYQSKTGTTQNYAQEIATYLETKQINASCFHVEEYNEELLHNTDFVFLGCWTSGLMFFFQKPDQTWNNFASKISIPDESKVALFTTYKIRTGSMFKNMENKIGINKKSDIKRFKSKDGKLTKNDQLAINELIRN